MKDFSDRGFLFRRWLGPLLLSREERAYRALEGIAGIPRLLRRISRQALAIERIDGAVLDRYFQGLLDRAFFRRLEETVARMHERGVVHLDLHQKRNIIVTPDLRPYVIDFASSLRLGTGWISRRITIPILARIDRYAILKFKARYAANLLQPEETRKIRRGHALSRLWVFRPVNSLKKRLVRRTRRTP